MCAGKLSLDGVSGVLFFCRLFWGALAEFVDKSLFFLFRIKKVNTHAAHTLSGTAARLYADPLVATVLLFTEENLSPD